VLIALLSLDAEAAPGPWVTFHDDVRTRRQIWRLDRDDCPISPVLGVQCDRPDCQGDISWYDEGCPDLVALARTWVAPMARRLIELEAAQ
jgi:hypothetical protein